MSIPATARPPIRLRSLDAFRGLTIGAMLIVNNPGTWSHVYPPLRHAEWHGCTPTDLIFPFFLFIVGVAMAFSSRLNPVPGLPAPGRHTVMWGVLKRAGILFGLGLLLNFTSLLLRLPVDLDWWRIPGVLQRIAICYALAAAIMLLCSPRTQLALGLLILLGYWSALTLLPTAVAPAERLTQAGNAVAWLDRAVLGATHMYRGSTPAPHDPEGILSTLPALVTTLIGAWTGRVLRRSAKAITAGMCGRLLLVGLLLGAIGWGWHVLPPPFGFPLNKELWTSSYVLFTAGCALVLLAACAFLCEVLPGSLGNLQVPRWRRIGQVLLWPAEVMGLNAILAFVGSGLLARAMLLVRVQGSDGQPVPLSRFLYESIFQTPSRPELGSLLYAVAVLLFWWVICYVLHIRRWYWKI